MSKQAVSDETGSEPNRDGGSIDGFAGVHSLDRSDAIRGWDSDQDVVVGMPVSTRTGQAGEVTRLLRDPEIGVLTDFVVRTRRLPGRDLVVPVGWVSRVSGEGIYLDVEAEELAKLPLYRTDEEISADVEAAMERDLSTPPLNSSVLRVDVRYGVVTLTGYASDAGSRSRTEEVIESVRGVRGLRSELIADDELETRVARALADDPRTHDLYIRVHVAQGVAHLTGTLENEALSAETKAAAEEIAANVPGVRAVVSHLPGTAATARPLDRLPRIGLPVYTGDGELGRLEAVVMTRRFWVTHLIVAGRVPTDDTADPIVGSEPSPRRWLVPVSALKYVAAEAILLGDDLMGIRELPTDDELFLIPDAVWQASFDYRREAVRLARAESAGGEPDPGLPAAIC